MRDGSKTDCCMVAGARGADRACVAGRSALVRRGVPPRRLFNPWFGCRDRVPAGHVLAVEEGGQVLEGDAASDLRLDHTATGADPVQTLAVQNGAGQCGGVSCLEPDVVVQSCLPGLFQGNSTDEGSTPWSRVKRNRMGVYLFVSLHRRRAIVLAAAVRFARVVLAFTPMVHSSPRRWLSSSRRWARTARVQPGRIRGADRPAARRGRVQESARVDGHSPRRDAGVHFGYSVTVTRENNDVVASDEFVELMMAHAPTAGMTQYMPVGCAPDAALMPDAAQRERRRQRLAELRRTKDINLYDFVNDGPMVGGCLSAGRYCTCTSTVRGGTQPCAFYPFAADNIRGGRDSRVAILQGDARMST